MEGPIGARLRTYQVARLAERPINNAQLVGVLIYRTHLDWFERWYQQHGGEVARSVAELIKLMEGAEGSAAFERLAAAIGVDPAAAASELSGLPGPDSVLPERAAP